MNANANNNDNNNHSSNNTITTTTTNNNNNDNDETRRSGVMPAPASPRRAGCGSTSPRSTRLYYVLYEYTLYSTDMI